MEVIDETYANLYRVNILTFTMETTKPCGQKTSNNNISYDVGPRANEPAGLK